MPKKQANCTKLDIRIPDVLYAEIEAIAVEEGAKTHHISNKPTLSPTVIKLLREAIEQRKYSTESEEDRILAVEGLVVQALSRVKDKLIRL